MSKQRWIDAWNAGRIGFHSDEVHGDLIAHERQFLGEQPRRVLVPLCGKTVDIPWLTHRGHHVVGVELVEKAVEQLHAEQSIAARRETDGPFVAYRSERLDVLCGDFFDLEAAHVGAIDRVWDRAALVALDPETRRRYVAKLRAIAPTASLLLNAFEYDQSRMDGPPFCVPESEIEQLFDGARVEVLNRRDAVDELPFADAGHEFWTVTTYWIEP